MIEWNIAKIIRVKNCHLEESAGMSQEGEVEKLLIEKGFVLKVSSADNFYHAYENPGYKDESKGTLVLIRSGGQGDIADIAFTTTR